MHISRPLNCNCKQNCSAVRFHNHNESIHSKIGKSGIRPLGTVLLILIQLCRDVMIILVGPAIQPCDNNNNSNNNEACNAPIPIRTRQFRRRVGAVKGKKDKLTYYTQPEEGGWGEALVEN